MSDTAAILERCDIGDCWEWQGALSDGYGQISYRGKTRLVHRAVWEGLVGPIPTGMQLDHLCRVRHCVNPDHLEVVTHRENTLRGFGAAARAARKTHCPSGHPYAGDNLYVDPDGGRKCRTCHRNNQTRYHARKKGS